MVRKLVFLLFLSIFLFSCSAGKGTTGSSSGMEKNQIELNVQNSQPENSTPASDPSPPDPIPKQEAQPKENNFFLSGRTELLSLYSQGRISAEGFYIGELYVENTATPTERDIIELCRFFIQSLGSEKINPYVDPSSQMEISDYYRYFFYNKIDIEVYLFGKPEIKAGEALVEMIIFPDAIPVYLYMTKKNNTWLISGMEADLRREKSESSVEKWAPSMSSSQPGGY